MNYHKEIYRLANNLSVEDFEILMENKYQKLSGYEVSDILLNEVAYCSGLKIETILKYNREKKIMLARQIFHFAVMKLTSLSDTEIGDKYGQFNRATVLNSVKRIQGYIDIDEPVLLIYKPLIDKYNLLKYKSIKN